jgi:hypothetical protein
MRSIVIGLPLFRCRQPPTQPPEVEIGKTICRLLAWNELPTSCVSSLLR